MNDTPNWPPEGRDADGEPLIEAPLTPPVCDIGPAPEPPSPDGLTVEDTVMPTAEDIERSRVEPGDNSGNEYGDAKRRHLLVLMPLADHRDPLHPERAVPLYLLNQMLEGDIREAMAKAARKLNDTAMKYRVRGYEWDLDDIVYDMPQPRTLAATLVIERE